MRTVDTEHHISRKLAEECAIGWMVLAVNVRRKKNKKTTKLHILK
jgi:hypothetical protein